MWARLATSDQPERIFEVTTAAASQAGLVGGRVPDSTPLYDPVATMDTVTLGAAIRGLLNVAQGGWRPSCRECSAARRTTPA